MTRDWDRLQASNSFRSDEIEAVRALLSALRRGGDVSALLRSAALRKVEAKFTRMAARIETLKAERLGKPKPTREEILNEFYQEQTE